MTNSGFLIVCGAILAGLLWTARVSYRAGKRRGYREREEEEEPPLITEYEKRKLIEEMSPINPVAYGVKPIADTAQDKKFRETMAELKKEVAEIFRGE